MRLDKIGKTKGYKYCNYCDFKCNGKRCIKAKYYKTQSKNFITKEIRKAEGW